MRRTACSLLGMPAVVAPVALVSLLAPVALLEGCATPDPTPEHAPRQVSELRRWEVRCGTRIVGELALLQIEDATRPVSFYHVRNAAGQWLGHIDADGRLHQRIPFTMDDVSHGIHPVGEALALLYDEQEPLVVVEIPVASTAKESPQDADTRRELAAPMPASSLRLPSREP